MTFESSNQDPPADLLFPGGLVPEIREPHLFRTYFTYSTQRRESEGIAREDFDSFLAAQYAYQIGLAEDEQIVAWGSVWVGVTAEGKDFPGEAVVTDKTLAAWWLPSPAGLIHTFTASHSDFTGYKMEGPTGGNFRWSTGAYANDEGRFHIENPVMWLASRPSTTDGHDARRALTFYFSFASLVRPASQ